MSVFSHLALSTVIYFIGFLYGTEQIFIDLVICHGCILLFCVIVIVILFLFVFVFVNFFCVCFVIFLLYFVVCVLSELFRSSRPLTAKDQ